MTYLYNVHVYLNLVSNYFSQHISHRNIIKYIGSWYTFWAALKFIKSDFNQNLLKIFYTT